MRQHRSRLVDQLHRPARAALAALCLAAALPAAAQSAQSAQSAHNAVTIYGGARFGGSFTDENDSDKTIDLASSGAFSASFEWPWGDGRQGQLFYSYQPSSLPGSAFGRSGDVDVDLSYFHVGGRSFFDGSAATRAAYVVGGLGVTYFSPGLDGGSSEWRPSMNVGVGYQWPVARNVMLRTELRGYVTLVNSSGGFLCSGGCTFAIAGDALWQGEAMVGLSVGF
jgi:opacity protein-like surface antigen